MKSVFDGSLDPDCWMDFVHQKFLFYSAIEGAATPLGLLVDLPDIQRSFKLKHDYMTMTGGQLRHRHRAVTIEYYNYVWSISQDPDKIMAHLYVWHLGDLFGGQMIKRMIPGSHESLEFEGRDKLISTIRNKLDDAIMGDEARVGFEWAIRILKQYDNTST